MHEAGLQVLTVLVGLLATPSLAAPGVVAHECAGTKTAAAALIYLHGIDPVEPTPQELGNRALLKRVAADLGMDLAILRSQTKCDNGPQFKGKLCWPRGTKDEIGATLAAVHAAADKCVAPNAARYVLGFSNGGFLLHHAVMHCAPSPVPARYVTVGGAGAFDGSVPPKAKGCGELDILIGKKDTYQYKEAKALAKQLVAIGRDVRLTEFGGGHVVPEGETRQLLLGRLAAAGHADRCDIPGGDLSGAKAASAAECRERCEKDKSCAGFTYVTGWGHCSLKKKVGRVARVRFFSGDRESKGEYDVDYSGKDMKKLPGTATGPACGEACRADPMCKAFAYIEGYRDCWLKSNVGNRREKIFQCGVVEASRRD